MAEIRGKSYFSAHKWPWNIYFIYFQYYFLNVFICIIILVASGRPASFVLCDAWFALKWFLFFFFNLCFGSWYYVLLRYKAAMIDDVPRIFEAVFQCTLEVRLYWLLFWCLFMDSISLIYFVCLVLEFHTLILSTTANSFDSLDLYENKCLIITSVLKKKQ